MDRDTAFIRAEISQTRSELDRKLARLEAKARKMSPRRAARRLMHERRFEQVMGVLLLCAGSLLAWRKRPRRTVAYGFARL